MPRWSSRRMANPVLWMRRSVSSRSVPRRRSTTNIARAGERGPARSGSGGARLQCPLYPLAGIARMRLSQFHLATVKEVPADARRLGAQVYKRQQFFVLAFWLLLLPPLRLGDVVRWACVLLLSYFKVVYWRKIILSRGILRV